MENQTKTFNSSTELRKWGWGVGWVSSLLLVEYKEDCLVARNVHVDLTRFCVTEKEIH